VTHQVPICAATCATRAQREAAVGVAWITAQYALRGVAALDLAVVRPPAINHAGGVPLAGGLAALGIPAVQVAAAVVLAVRVAVAARAAGDHAVCPVVAVLRA